jgi:hypothetical protein
VRELYAPPLSGSDAQCDSFPRRYRRMALCKRVRIGGIVSNSPSTSAISKRLPTYATQDRRPAAFPTTIPTYPNAPRARSGQLRPVRCSQAATPREPACRLGADLRTTRPHMATKAKNVKSVATTP